MRTVTKDTEDDAPLVEACINKDPSGWAALVKRYSALITLSISGRLKRYGFDPLCEETEDIYQNVLASIWEGSKLERVKNRKSIAHWLSIVSGNAAIEHMRKKMAGEKAKFVPISDEIDAELAGNITAENMEIPQVIEGSISLLPPKEQLIIKLNLLHGMGYHEISEMLKIPIGTVSSYIKRAKERLRNDLKDFK